MAKFKRKAESLRFDGSVKKKAKPPMFEEKISLECPLSVSERQSKSSIQPTDLLSCVICQEEKWDSKNWRVMEPLTQCVTFKAEYNLLDASRTRSHVRLVTELEEQDAIAKEVKYHRTCFTLYVNKKTLGWLADKAVKSELTDNGDAKIQAFSKLTQWLEEM